MKYLSRNPSDANDMDDTPLKNLYLFDQSAGDGFPVYIIDTGANLAHPVSGKLQCHKEVARS